MTSDTAPTLQDVARAAGVSTATISRSINDPDKVAKPTRDRIQHAIDTLGYTPNFGAKVLASNRTNTVGAVIPSMANAMFASGLQAFQEVLSEAGVTLLVASTSYDPDQELRQIKSLIAHGASGLMLIGTDRPQTTKDFLALRRVPHVISWCYADDPDQLFAGFDNVQAAYQMTQSVLAHGHRQIAMIAGISAHNDRARARITGVQAAIRDHGGTATLTQVVEARYRLEHGAEAYAQIMAGEDWPTAIICGNDVLAAGAMTQARRDGVSVPEDVSIVGFDDIGIATVLAPQLTTVRVPQIEMGRAAAELLLARLADTAPVHSIRLDTQVVMRETLGAID